MFVKYQHIEKFGTDEVENINFGTCYCFPKIDGTNGSVYTDTEGIKCASRNRELSLEDDNAGFCNYILNDERFINFFNDNPNLRLFGEFLCPHSLKTYRDDAWRKFYVFDITDVKDEYLIYEDYKLLLEKYNIDYIPCIVKIENGTQEQFVNILQHNNFLIKDGEGIGEGVVIKNYNFINKYGRKTWAKIVTSEFKEKHVKTMGAKEMKGAKIIEQEIVGKYLTQALIEKTFDKIRVECNRWSSKYIPRLLNTIWHDFVNEEIWNIIKEYKNPTINFKDMMFFCNEKIKKVKSDLF